MLFNYFRTWFRNVIKYRTYAAINLLGLGVGIACCYLCVLYLLYDWSFDRFHENHQRIYRVAGKVKYSETIRRSPKAGTETEIMSFPVALSSMMSAEFPEIELTTRVTSDLSDWAVGTHRDFLRPIQKVLFVDRSFEEMFSFPLIRGTFFSRPEQVVITRRFARTLTNDIDSLIGKVLWLRFSHSLFKDLEPIVAPIEIGGIVETPPRNSSLDFEILLPLSMSATFLDREEGDWDWRFISTHYIRLADETNMEAVEGKLTRLIQKQSSFNSLWNLNTFKGRPQPITDMHHYPGPGRQRVYGVRRSTNPLYGYILGGMSVLVLSVACLNYVLLYVARFNSRTKELSIRQIFGANRRHLRYQLLVECFGYSILACIIGLAVAELASSPLEGILQTPLMSSTDPVQTATILLLIACLIGLGTALYPATFMSSVSPVSVLSKTAKAVRSGPFLKVLMAIQSGVTLVFVLCSIIIFEQTFFVITTDPGFESINLLKLDISKLNENEIDRLQESLSEHSLVTSCVRTNLPLGWGNQILMKDSSGKLIDEVIYYQVDGPFLETVGLQLLQGKPLYPNPIPGDVIVNETFLKHLTSPEPIGQVIEPVNERSKARVFGSDFSGRIVGVVKDFHFRDLRHTVSPALITIAQEPPRRSTFPGEILIRIQENSADEFVPYLEKLWKDLKIGGLLTFSFVEDDRRTFYAKEISWSKIVSGAALCAVLIASMGALGMISLSVARRRKEIAIRRVMGAVPSKIASGIVLNYAVPGFIAAIIALPLSYFFMDEWLSIFAYRFQFGVGTILTAISLGILLPLICGFVHALKVASESPSNALRED